MVWDVNKMQIRIGLKIAKNERRREVLRLNMWECILQQPFIDLLR